MQIILAKTKQHTKKQNMLPRMAVKWGKTYTILTFIVTEVLQQAGCIRSCLWGRNTKCQCLKPHLSFINMTIVCQVRKFIFYWYQLSARSMAGKCFLLCCRWPLCCLLSSFRSFLVWCNRIYIFCFWFVSFALCILEKNLIHSNVLIPSLPFPHWGLKPGHGMW